MKVDPFIKELPGGSNRSTQPSSVKYGEMATSAAFGGREATTESRRKWPQRPWIGRQRTRPSPRLYWSSAVFNVSRSGDSRGVCEAVGFTFASNCWSAAFSRAAVSLSCRT